MLNNLYNNLLIFIATLQDFLKALLLCIKDKILADLSEIAFFYKALFKGLLAKLNLLNGKLSHIFFFFLWLTIYLLLITQGVYIKYLVAKFIFFSAKYIWNFAFCILNFIFFYFFKDSFIMKLYNLTFKNLQQIVNFFIFYGIPNLFNIDIWAVRGAKYALLLKKIGLSFLSILRNLLFGVINLIFYKIPWYCKYLYMLSLTIWIWFLGFTQRIKFFFFRCLRYIHWRFNYTLWAIFWYYRFFCFKYSARGYYVWKKRYILRLNFLANNVKRKTFKYWVTFTAIFLKYKCAKLNLNVRLFFSLSYVLLKYNSPKLSFKFHFYKFFILYHKITLVLWYLCLKFVSLLITIQIIYRAVFNKLGGYGAKQYKKDEEAVSQEMAFTMQRLKDYGSYVRSELYENKLKNKKIKKDFKNLLLKFENFDKNDIYSKDFAHNEFLLRTLEAWIAKRNKLKKEHEKEGLKKGFEKED